MQIWRIIGRVRRFGILASLSLLLMAVTGGAAWAATVIRLGHVGFPGSLFDTLATKYAKEVNETLKGRVEVKVFHSSQLGTDEQMIKGVKIGAVEMFIPSTIMSTVDQRYGIFEMPYIIVNRAHMKRVTENPQAQKALLDGLPGKGVRVIGFWENGFRHITNNVRPIVKPEDLKGIKLRVPGGVWRVKMFKAYGANPSPMPFAEVYSALQSGVMDGQENPFPQIWGGKFQEVQKYLSLTGHVYTPAYLTVGKTKWDSLPPDVRKILEDTAKETQAFVYEVAAKDDGELEGKLKASGMQVNDVDKNTFIAASKPIYEEFGKEVAGAKDVIDRAVALGN